MNIQLNSNRWPISKPQPNDDECYTGNRCLYVEAIQISVRTGSHKLKWLGHSDAIKTALWPVLARAKWKSAYKKTQQIVD